MEPVLQKILANSFLYYQSVHIREGKMSLMFIVQGYSRLMGKLEDTKYNLSARKFMIPMVEGLLKELKVLEQRMVKLLHSLENTTSDLKNAGD